MADPATYEMKFTFTWNEVCHPGTLKGYSVFPPVWSWPVGVSHNTEYRMWDACMDDVSVWSWPNITDWTNICHRAGV